MYLYILHSAKLDQFYVGISKRPRRRLKQHNSGVTFWTSRSNDWEIVHLEEVDSLAEGRLLEQKVKQRGARRYLEERLPNPAEAGRAERLSRRWRDRGFEPRLPLHFLWGGGLGRAHGRTRTNTDWRGLARTDTDER